MLGVGTILVARIVAERELAWYIREVLCFGLQEATLSKNRLYSMPHNHNAFGMTVSYGI